MDYERPGHAKKVKRRRMMYLAGAAAVIILLTVGISSLEPAAPSVAASSVWIGEVERGSMLRQVRGPGSLVPEEFRWVSARTDGVVEQIHLKAGVEVTPDTVILELANPELEQRLEDARLALARAESELVDLRVQLERDLLSQRAAAAAVESDLHEARLEHEAYEELAGDGLIPDIELKRSKIRAEQLDRRYALEGERLAKARDSIRAQLASQRSQLAQARALYDLRRREVDDLQVRAGIGGVLQEVPVEVGQRVSAGTPLARVAQPDELKAELRIAETQAKDLQVGLPAKIDTRNGIVPGTVVRIDPAVREGTVTVDVALEGALPPGARPDLSVDGTIEIEHLENVLHVGRPTYGQPHSRVELFKLIDGGEMAVRVPVELGRSSVDRIEIVSGLEAGDRVILSDVSQYDEADRLELE